jgi:hypothetical protein
MLVARVGWRLDDDTKLPLAGLTVKLATQLLCEPARAARAVDMSLYVVEALDGVQDVDGMPRLLEAFVRLWALRWENENKEVFWRLAVDGVPLMGNTHVRTAVPHCGCGGYGNCTRAEAAPVTPRMHYFWLCPVARAVCDVIERQCGVLVARHHLWLCCAPEGIMQPVWDVVVLAGVSAMERGRQYMSARRKEVASVLITRPLCERAAARAVAFFWGRLHSFAALGEAPSSWRDVPPTHALLARSPAGRVVCADVLPVGV